MEKKNRKRQKTADMHLKMTLGGVLTGIAGFLFLVTCAVVLVLNFRPLYYYDVSALQLSEEPGLSEKVIEQNYDVLIDYNLFWKNQETLEFPDFPMSEEGRIHFEEVKHIFTALQYGMIGSLLLFLCGIIWNVRRKSYQFCRVMAVSSLAVPAGLGAIVAVDWEYFFIRFHKLMFSNDYWLFDPAQDPVILILPDEFFFHCAAAVILCIAVGGIICEIVYRMVRRKYGTIS